MPTCFSRMSNAGQPAAKHCERRLICIPHSGGSCFAFKRLGSLLPQIEVLGVTLPGRGQRFLEKPEDSWEKVGDYLASQVRNLPPKPYALLGHSLGGLLVFELARRLVESDALHPCVVGLSACPPPHRADPNSLTEISRLPDQDLMGLLVSWGGLPEADLKRPALSQIMPGVRADFALGGDLRASQMKVRLPIQCVVWGSPEDELVKYEDLRDWQEYTDLPLRHEELTGNHYYLPNFLSSMATVLEEEFESHQGTT